MLLARGRSADVFALDARRVLRRYRDGGDVSAEAAVMAYVGRLGFAVPRVDLADGSDLVMERLDGPTMLGAVASGALDVTDCARQLADLHTHLHKLPARCSRDPAVRILHLDLHPENVVLSPRGAVVIDWTNSAEGPPDLDTAMTALIMAQVAVNGTDGRAEVATAVVRAFLAYAEGEPRRVLDEAVAVRAADPNLTPHEVRLLSRAAGMVAAGG
jgi:aminoglycoside phosphotransferase (APT) family kinase protein